MLGLLLGAALIPAIADLQATAGNDIIVLHKSACTLPAALSVVPDPKTHSELHSGDAVISNQPYKLCWVDLGEAVGMIFEDGDTLAVPKSAFKERGV